MLIPHPITAQPTAQDTDADIQLVANNGGDFSVYLPGTWVFASMPANEAYAATLLAADNAALLADLSLYQLAQPPSGTSTGAFAIIMRLTPQFWQTVATNPEEAVQKIIQLIATNSPVYQQFTAELGTGSYASAVIETEAAELNAYGILALFVHDGEVYILQLMVAPAEGFEANAATLEAIAGTLSIPADAAALTTSSTNQSSTTAAGSTSETLATDDMISTPLQVDAEGGVLSVVLPTGWLFLDRTAEDDLFIFADTQAALDARLYGMRPSLYDAPVAITGLGGVIELHSLADLGLAPTNPDVSGLMTRLLGSLAQQNYEVIEQPALIRVGEREGQMAVIRGSEYGFLALVPVGDQLAYITGTGTPANFEASYDLLSEIVGSIRVPAAAPEPAATPATGLGGLGGLQNSGEATAVPATGLGGLGGMLGEDTGTATEGG